MLTAFLAALQAQPVPPIIVTPLPPPQYVIAPAPPPPGGRPAFPRRPIVTLFTADDYPVAAMDSDQQGLVTVELVVGVDGRISACRIVETSDSPILDQVTCAIIQRRARFVPAIDGKGTPVPDHWRQRVRWEMEALPFEPFERVTRVATGPRATVASCAGSLDCDDSGFTLQLGWMTLTGRPLPASSALVVERRFDPGDHAVGTDLARSGEGYQTHFAGRARVGINHNGKVTRCVALRGGVGDSDRLCSLASQWLFRLGGARGETRSGVISMALRAGPPPVANPAR